MKMNPWTIGCCVAAAVYAMTGFYIVNGNEKAVVRRFGRAVVSDTRAVVLKDSGLHWNLPWPFGDVDRVNLNEVRVITIGGEVTEDLDTTGFLRSVRNETQSQFLTGDKNVLNIHIAVQHRIAESGVYEYLFDSQATDARLSGLVESAVTDLVSRSGVDYVHPLGLAELQDMLTQTTQRLVQQHALGVTIERVSVEAVAPPLRVKAHFLDVANARNDKQKFINSAQAYAEQMRETAKAEASRLLNATQADAESTTESARATADRFRKLIDQFAADGYDNYKQTRQLALQRRYLDTIEAVLPLLARQLMFDSSKPTDLTIFGRSDD